MDRDPSTTGTRRDPLLGWFVVLAVSYPVFHGDGREEFAAAAIVLAAGSLTTLVGLRSAGLRRVPAGLRLGVSVGLPSAGLSLAKRLGGRAPWALVGRAVGRVALVTTVLAVALAAAYLATRVPDVFPGLALPGMLDGRGISGLGQLALFVLEVLMLMALAVHLLRVTVSTARERTVPARAEVAG